jgi:prepilin-type N-terminal cleavage/methylation domain-containing protein
MYLSNLSSHSSPKPSSVKGFTIVEIVVAVVILAVIGGGAYLYFARQGMVPTPPLPGLKSVVLNPNCDYKDPDLCKFMNNFTEQRYYTVTATSTDNKGTKSLSTFKMDGNDKTSMSMSDGQKEAYAFISIGNTTYTKDLTDNQWWKQMIESSKDSDDDWKFDLGDDNLNDNKVDDTTTYKKIGKEGCEKQTCFKYQSIEKSDPDTINYLWFDDREYQLRKTETKTKDGSTHLATYSYDKVTIAEPSPIKELKDGQIPTGTYDASQMGLSEEDQKKFEQLYQDMQQEQTDVNLDASNQEEF